MSTEKQVLPFFVRYLENQAEDMSIEELNEISGGNGQVVTMAYPSDSDTADGGYSTEQPKSPFDMPKFSTNLPFPQFGYGSPYIK
ncbi:microviridin/marinostatin family tricyclic proteinase inhibitor [Calothrix sp. PCC 6303]|uniref:microviridin/marinostatin family tricyclic proteinase inhibitor n=1 Tax=Calothrix sp. PCC 6303 TaxID=1170562 RepID=UPI0002A041E6|nr:microviridin/marinostatin family tricyclic proteinase inhibitor [Calothrix sp. PCC 6303]AFZ03236.1 hypothetical protein Cal6303_4329 [Calothrix sp. PCC 6303]